MLTRPSRFAEGRENEAEGALHPRGPYATLAKTHAEAQPTIAPTPG